MADFLQMLRARNVLGRQDSPLGLPNFEVGDPFEGVMGLAEEAKNQDMRRRKELMQFQQTMQQQADAPRVLAEKIALGRKLNPANKNYVLGAGSGSGQLKPSTVERDNAVNDAKAQELNQEFARTNELRNEKAAQRASAESIANKKIEAESMENKTQREFQATEADKARKDRAAEAKDARMDKGWQVFNTVDPNDPNKTIPKRMNLATGEVQDVNTGTLMKPGTKLPTSGRDPKMESARNMAQSALDELNQLVDEKGNLSTNAARATGKSAIPGRLMDKAGLGSFASTYKQGNVGINTLKSKLLLNLLGELKAQSKTGATGFGNMNLKELGVLEQAIGNLDTDLPDEAFAKELVKIRGHLNKILEDSPEEAKAKKTPGSPEERKAHYDNLIKERGY